MSAPLPLALLSAGAWVQCALLVALLLALAPALGAWIARVVQAGPAGPVPWLGPVERALYRWAGVRPEQECGWRRYAGALLLLNAAGFVVVLLLQLLQHQLPLNPGGLPAVRLDSAFNTAVSFVTNTDWQGYAGETTLSYLTQMAGLGVQNFLSAATGLAALVALARGLARHTCATVGNPWVDVVRGVLYVLLPLSLLLALALAAQGVVQTFEGPVSVERLDAASGGEDGAARVQTLARGPAASQVAIKQLGTNGGGFFNANSAHPLENPTPLSNLLQLLSLLLIPAALCSTFGRLVGDPRQGRALLAAMLVLLLPLLVLAVAAEEQPSPVLTRPDVDATVRDDQPGGNMEGKEARIGSAGGAVWAVATTAASNGSVNAMHDSFTPLGGLAPLLLMQLGEVVFGGVGSGLYGLLAFALVAVFVAGLMIGRTPEYLGKKIEAFEMKMVSIALLAPTAAVLIGTAVAVALPQGRASVQDPGPHGFSEVLYAFSSAGNNNGSAFAGLAADTPFYNVALALAMLVGRYFVLVPMLAVAGSLAAKRRLPAGPGTLPSHGPLFVLLLAATVVLVGALTFLPSLALGPLVEHLGA